MSLVDLEQLDKSMEAAVSGATATPANVFCGRACWSRCYRFSPTIAQEVDDASALDLDIQVRE